MKKLKKQLVSMTLLAMALQMFAFRSVSVFAFVAGDVVINEVAWAGSADASGDEWIELYNSTNQSIDLSGWYIEDDASSSYLIESGAIAAHSYFVIEDNEGALSGSADAVIGLSLANAGDSLVLKDPAGNAIDAVNGGGGAWYAGNATSKASMERIDPQVLLDNADNWASAAFGNGSKGSAGSDILGTPGGANSNYGGAGPEISFQAENVVYPGEVIDYALNVSDANDLYAYGFEINYNPALLHFVAATESGFLAAGGANTAFNAALVNGDEGKLSIGNARLINPAQGVDGSGTLFNLSFEIVGNGGEQAELNFGGSSFLSDSQGDVQAKYSNFSFTIGEGSGQVATVAGLKLNEGQERYSIDLIWEAGDADSYVIKKKLPSGEYIKIGETNETSFTDDNSIIPNVNYDYQLLAVKGSASSAAVSVSGKESRGISGDNDRSDSVDGKDIEKLARAFGSEYGDEEYNPLADTNFDGVIDGADLIDIGVNFAMTY